MKLKIKPHHSNIYPAGGFLIKDKKLTQWLIQLQELKINLNETPVYAIPDTKPNSLWGCFVLSDAGHWKQKLSSQEYCQSIYNRLFIPQYSTVYPVLGHEDIQKLFAGNPHILHPEFGLFELDEPINWRQLIVLPNESKLEINPPVETKFIPQDIKKVELQSLSPETLIEQMEESVFPKKEEFSDKPLNLKEKIKLKVLKSIFSSKENTPENHPRRVNKLVSMLGKLFSKQNKWLDRLGKDLEKLEQRNRSEMEKLIKLFEKNPEEALKFAIPLDNEGTSRGGTMGKFKLSRRWNNFSLFGNQTSGGRGNAMFKEDAYQKLHQQYFQSAQKFVQQKDYKKAAFIYMKLLQNNHLAAQTLEEGKMYPEAASVYLKYLKNKHKAAECYENGLMTSEAISMYKDLNMHEKAGDLYMTQNKKKEAFSHYQKVIEDYKEQNQYVKASLLYRNKMDDTSSAQDLLMDGWRNGKDASNCLNNYFQNLEDRKLLKQAIENTYLRETNDNNKSEFLRLLKYEHRKDKSLEDFTREIAYEIVAELADKNPAVVNELKNFNHDKSLEKDLHRFKRY